MSRPTRILREAAASPGATARRTGPALAGPSTYIKGYQAAQKDKSPINYLVLHDVPRTATHQDILRALQQRSIVSKDFPLSSITMPPPSFPRSPSLTKSVHLTLNRDRAISDHAVNTIRRSPLFPDLTSKERRPYFNCGMIPGPVVSRTDRPAYDWVNGFIRALPTLKRTSTPTSTTSSGSGGGGGERLADKVPPIPEMEWCMDTRYRGRRVVIKGLPGTLDERFVRLLAEGCGVEQGNRGRMEESDDVKCIPPVMGSYTSTWVITTDSVANACRLVRRTNRQYYNQGRHQTRYPMRAEIAW